jgi:hypothetical protein
VLSAVGGGAALHSGTVGVPGTFGAQMSSACENNVTAAAAARCLLAVQQQQAVLANRVCYCQQCLEISEAVGNHVM